MLGHLGCCSWCTCPTTPFHHAKGCCAVTTYLGSHFPHICPPLPVQSQPLTTSSHCTLPTPNPAAPTGPWCCRGAWAGAPQPSFTAEATIFTPNPNRTCCSLLLQGYLDWCSHVDLPPRFKGAQLEALQKQGTPVGGWVDGWVQKQGTPVGG